VSRPPRTVADPNLVVGYVRVSTDEQAISGLGLAAQRAAIQAECARRDWTLVAVHEDPGVSGKTMDRPGLAAALADVEQGRAAALVVSKVDRLSRSSFDFVGLLERAQRGRWNLVALDVNVDTTTPQGEMMASVMAIFAQLERRLIGQRTRDALAAKKAQGVRLGRPQLLPPEVVERIRSEHTGGAGWSAIARQLNAAGVPTAHGGARWYPATVRYVVGGATAYPWGR
jgi:DNA invertase Pin-like site-specific DNA recombinase